MKNITEFQVQSVLDVEDGRFACPICGNLIDDEWYSQVVGLSADMETEYCSSCNLLFIHKERESSDMECCDLFGDDKESCDGYYFHLIQSWKYKGVTYHGMPMFESRDEMVSKYKDIEILDVVCFDEVCTAELISYNYDENVSYVSEDVP